MSVASSVSGRIELQDSRDPSVQKKKNFSGVVVSFEPVNKTDVSKSGPARARMIQKDKTFTPHILPVTTGTTVDFPNFDPIFHNAFSNYDGQIFDIGLYSPGTSRSVRFSREGVVRIFCNIHPHMSAAIVVLGTPWFDVTKPNGTFEVQGLPPGEYRMRIFHERATEEMLRRQGRIMTVSLEPMTLPVIAISESGYLPIPHKNKYGREYRPPADEAGLYPTVKK